MLPALADSMCTVTARDRNSNAKPQPRSHNARPVVEILLQAVIDVDREYWTAVAAASLSRQRMQQYG